MRVILILSVVHQLTQLGTATGTQAASGTAMLARAFTGSSSLSCGK